MSLFCADTMEFYPPSEVIRAQLRRKTVIVSEWAD